MDSRKASAKNLECVENSSKRTEALIKSGGILPEIESIAVEDCASDILSQNTEILRQVHLFNLTGISSQR